MPDADQLRQEALAASEARLRSAFAGAAIGMVITNLDGTRFEAMNEAYARNIGYTREELMRTDCVALTHPDDVPEMARRIGEAVRGEVPGFILEKRYLHRLGHVVWVRNSVSVIRDAAGRPAGLLALVEDITERKRAEEALREAHASLEAAGRARSELLRMLAHDLGNPLTAAAMRLVLLENTDLTPRQRDELARVGSSLEQVKALVGRIVDAARLEQAEMRFERERLDLGALVEEGAQTYEVVARTKGVRLEVKAQRPLPVDGDRQRLLQVVGNLLSNAIKFTPPGGRVAVTALRDGPRAVLTVEDTGAGWDPRDTARLFEPFARLHAGSSEGTGLGLYICRGIVGQHGGTVRAESPGPGRGALLTATLPLAEAGAAPEGASAMALPQAL